MDGKLAIPPVLGALTVGTAAMVAIRIRKANKDLERAEYDRY